jgi:integrase/recombinase XerC
MVKYHLLMSIFDAMLQRGYISIQTHAGSNHSPAASGKKIMKGIVLPKFISKEQTERLFNAISYPKHRSLVMVMYGLALRLSEAINIRLVDLNSSSKLVLIQGKGQKQRLIKCNDKYWNIICECYKMYHPKEFLFEDCYGKPYGQRFIRQVVYDASHRAGLPHVHPHMLRHSQATHMLDANVDLFKVKTILGHAFMSTTAIYLHTAVDSLGACLQ